MSQLLKKILRTTLEDVMSSEYKTGINFVLYDSSKHVGYFMGYSLVEMCEGSGCPKLTPRFLCFDTEGVQTACDPQFKDIFDQIAYQNTMNPMRSWEQQIDIKQTIDATTESHTQKIQP